MTNAQRAEQIERNAAMKHAGRTAEAMHARGRILTSARNTMPLDGPLVRELERAHQRAVERNREAEDCLLKLLRHGSM